jgi:signal transduction histidine kinase/HAMP domain-containing protein
MKFTRYGIKLYCFFLLVALIPLCITGVAFYKYAYDKTKEDVLSKQQLAVHSLNRELQHLLSRKKVRIMDFSTDGFVRDCVERVSFGFSNDPQISKELNSHLILNNQGIDTDIIEIEVLDCRGQVIASTFQDQIGKNRSDKDYFRFPFLLQEEKGPIFVGVVESPEATNNLQLVFSTVLTDKILHRPMGVISTKIDIKIMQNILKQHLDRLGMGNDNSLSGVLCIVDNNNMLNIANTGTFNGININQLFRTKAVQQVSPTRREWSGVYKNYKGVSVLGTSMLEPESHLLILLEKRTKEAFASLVKIKYIFASSGGGAFLFVCVFAFMFTRNSSAAISEFTSGSRRVLSGDLEHPITIPNRKDEISELINSFNLMIGKQRKTKAIESKCHDVQILAAITRKINAGLTLDEVLNLVFESFKTIIPYARIGVAFLDDKAEKVEAYWARSDSREIKLGKGYSVNIEETSLNDVILKQRPRIINDLEKYLESHPQSDSTKRVVEEGMRSSLTCPLFASGKPIGFMFFSSTKVDTYLNAHKDFFIQISGQIATIIEKSQLYQRLVELNELKNNFLGMAAHDLQNPNVLMRLYLNQLVESLGDVRGDQNVWISKIQSISDSMLSLTKDFLCISSIEAGQLRLKQGPILPDVFLADCLENNKHITKEKSIALKLDIDEGLPIVYIDSDRLSQVINNLITNATKYSHPSTEIILSARLREKEVEVSVTDQGQGVPEDEVHKLFKMFGKTSVRPTSGEVSTGIGLAICKHIVEAHGCRIWVESKGMGKGSIFKFTMPLN